MSRELSSRIADSRRIVITGVGLAAPGAASLAEFRRNLLAGTSGITTLDLRYMGVHPAGVCAFAETRYRKKRENSRGTRAGCIGVYCANEALQDAGIDFSGYDRAATGVYIGLTEHGTVETENEVFNIGQYGNDVDYWTHHHNPRTVLNNPAGEITMNLGLTGPHYSIGAACAAGNAALIQGVQMLRLGEVDLALCGGLSECVGSFGIFASFRAQGALAGVEATAPFLAMRFSDAQGRLVVDGKPAGLSMTATVSRAQVADTTDPLRFLPLTAVGVFWTVPGERS